MTSFDFSEEERWDPSSARQIPVGNWVATIIDAEPGTSSGGHPQIEVKVEKDGNQLRAWVVITAASLGRVLQLTEAAGLEKPGAVDVESEEWTAYVHSLVGRDVGIIVKDVPRNDDPTKIKRSIEAWCTPEELGQESADAPADMAGLGAGQGAAAVDEDIPF